MSDAVGLYTIEASGADDVTFSPDQTRIYVANSNGDIDVFDAATHAKITSWDVGVSLGALSVSPDGSFLMATEQTISDSQSTVYKVDTSTGAVTPYYLGGQAFTDVQVVDQNTAIMTGGQDLPTSLDISSGVFTTIDNAVFYSNSSVLSHDGHYTLFSEEGISNGPLFLYSDLTHSIVASGDDYQSTSTGFNFGDNAVSEKAGLVLQFSYYGGINVYDLNLHFEKVVNIGEPIGGMTFDSEGKNVFIFLANTGAVAEYDVATWTKIDQIDVGMTVYSGAESHGDKLTIDESGKHLTVLDPETGVLKVIDLTPRDETFTGTAGADSFAGGKGDDTYYVNNTGDTITEFAYQGVDRVFASVSYTLPNYVENLTLQGSVISGTGNGLDNVITGNSANNTLHGLGGNDRLDGGLGDDNMYGGTGDDTYVVNSVGDHVIENTGEGTDTVESNIAYTLGAYVENLTLKGTAAINGTGNIANNVIQGNSAANTLLGLGGADTLSGGAGADRLDGGTGADVMSGGTGNDTYVVDNASDTVVENPAEGIDTVESSVSFTLGANVEKLTLTGAAAISGTGNELANTIQGNAGANVLYGMASVDTLYGGGGNDRLDGGAGSDTMYGGLGNDTYVVDSATDKTIENVGEGTDTVESSVSRVLGANLENLTLTGTGAMNGTGNELANIIHGNGAANVLQGMAGADMLYGGDGNDRLDGGLDNDTMYGGTGNDVYVVDNAGDRAIEYAGEGTDRVESSVTYTLMANLEDLTLAGSSAINGTGNSLGNVIRGNGADNALHGLGGNDTMYGNAGADLMDGGSGDDTMYGGTGDDTYIVDSLHDLVVERAGEGTDTVDSAVTYTLAVNVENLTLTGIGSINGTGNSVANIIIGNAGANVITGGGGADTLTGGDGIDTFVFKTVADSAPGASDTITDLTASDKIDLSLIDADSTLAGNQTFVRLSGDGDFTAAGQFRLTFDGVNTHLDLNTNADATAEMTILIAGDHTEATAADHWIL